jgi:hypothetical protein
MTTQGLIEMLNNDSYCGGISCRGTHALNLGTACPLYKMGCDKLKWNDHPTLHLERPYTERNVKNECLVRLTRA